jgi:hypothetical protein
VNKVFLYTYWFMAGRESGERSKVIDRAWLTSILPPFYKGTGINIRIGPWSVKFGVCHPRMPVTVDEYTYVDDMEENLEALVGYELEQNNKEIRSWGSSTRSRPTHVTEESSGASSPS